MIAMRTCLFLILFLSWFSPARAAAPVADVVAAPQWRAGATWEYSDGYALKVRSFDGDVAVFDRVDAPGQWFSMRGFLRQDATSGTAVRRTIYRTIDPEAGRLLSSAKPLTFQREYLSGDQLMVHASSWTVEGKERITVPAGTFDCWVLVYRTRSLQSNWTGFERWWYSPEIQGYVRMEYKYGPTQTSSRVLMRYSLPAPAIAAPSPVAVKDLAEATVLRQSYSTADVFSGNAEPTDAFGQESGSAEIFVIQPPPPLQPNELFLLSRDAIQDAAIKALAQFGDFVIEPQEPPMQAAPSVQAPPRVQGPPIAQAPAELPATERKPKPVATHKARHQWAVQTDSFQNLDNARKRLTAVRRRREEADEEIESGIEIAVLGNRGTFHRVWLGSFESEREAKQLCSLMKADGTSPGCFVRVRNGAAEPLHVATAIKA